MPLSDLDLRDQQDTMEHPFFALSKGRTTPLEYKNGDVSVRISPNASHGMATIWDADIIIWAASTINRLQQAGDRKALEELETDRTLRFHPTELLRAIHRSTGGRDVKDLRAALERLTSTYISTTIRQHHQGRTQAGGFSWLDSWSEIRAFNKAGSEQTIGLSITLSNWLYRGIIRQPLLLAIESDYFELSGGYERWLWRLGRKHAHGSPDGWSFALETLYKKSGSSTAKRFFKRDLKKIVEKGFIQGYGLEWQERPKGEDPVIRIFLGDPDRPLNQRIKKAKERKSAQSVGFAELEANPALYQDLLSPYMLSKLLTEFPSADLKDSMARFVSYNRCRVGSIKNMSAMFVAFVREDESRKRRK